MTSIVEPPCPISLALLSLSLPPAKPLRESLPNLLLESDSLKCLGAQMFPQDGAIKELPVLIELMRSDSSAEIRMRAANVLGGVVAGRREGT